MRMGHGVVERMASDAEMNIAAVTTSDTLTLDHRASDGGRSNHRGPFAASIADSRIPNPSSAT